jgi:hypothetical protein
MSRSRKRRQPGNRAGHTLSLFDPAAQPAGGKTEPRPTEDSRPVDLALEAYWSAALHAHALAAASAHALYPGERYALRRLSSCAKQCQDLADELLDRIWHIQLHGAERASQTAA